MSDSEQMPSLAHRSEEERDLRELRSLFLLHSGL